jgi:hypothetical protein
LGLPGNIAQLHRHEEGIVQGEGSLQTVDAYRQFFLSIVRLPVAHRLPRSVQPDPYFDWSVTLGWLFDGVRSGRIPAPSSPPTHAQIVDWNLRLAWQPGHPSTSGTCRTLSLPARTHVASGTSMTSSASVLVTAHYGADQKSTPVFLRATSHPMTYVTSWPFDLSIAPTASQQSVRLCSASP